MSVWNLWKAEKSPAVLIVCAFARIMKAYGEILLKKVIHGRGVM